MPHNAPHPASAISTFTPHQKPASKPAKPKVASQARKPQASQSASLGIFPQFHVDCWGFFPNFSMIIPHTPVVAHFVSASPLASPPSPCYCPGMPKPSPNRVQARKLRDLCFRLAVQIAENPLDEELKQRAICLDRVVRAWENACERERISAGRPLPGSIRPERKPRKPRSGLGVLGVGPVQPSGESGESE